MKVAQCPKCGSKRLMLQAGKLTCTNCSELIGKTNEGRSNKYGAKKTEFNGKRFDSRFEASVAMELETMKRAGEIKDYDTQYRVEMPIHRQDGLLGFIVKHKVDFRRHNNDGSFTLIEAKGVETDDYKWRRRCLEELWLPFHRDHDYQVIKQHRR
ncbi:MAG TPA: DUF1064 domain-containing protein [Candidatus Saccharimonadales bacterium]|nr:DUF1064 domain-containing protein [Candidatus Saccharimonadales bacterium]